MYSIMNVIVYGNTVARINIGSLVVRRCSESRHGNSALPRVPRRRHAPTSRTTPLAARASPFEFEVPEDAALGSLLPLGRS